MILPPTFIRLTLPNAILLTTTKAFSTSCTLLIFTMQAASKVIRNLNTKKSKSIYMKTKLLLTLLTAFTLTTAEAQSWSVLTSGTSLDLNDICFANDDNGWGAGENGIIRHTVNGGTSWAAQTSGTTKELYNIH